MRLFHIEDDYFIDDINEAEKLFKHFNLLPVPEVAADDGEVDVVTAAIKKKCKCCCAAHCSLSKHSVNGQLAGVSLTNLYSSVTPDVSMTFPFTKEDVSRADFAIASNGQVDNVIKDELYSVITCLETQFSLE